jgi:hypothetical protein
MEGNLQGPLHSNTLLTENKYLSENLNSLNTVPKKLEPPKLPNFRKKQVSFLGDGFCLFFKEINNKEYWISEERNKNSYFVQWIILKDSTPEYIQRKIVNRNGLDVKIDKRDNILIKTLKNKEDIEKT